MINKVLFSLLIFLQFIFYSCAQENNNNELPPKPPRGYINESILKIAYAIGFIDLVDTEPAVPDNIEEHKDIVYKLLDSTSLKLDIYKRKEQKEAAPVLIFIHGGAWKSGKRSDYLRYLIDYAQKGYITATISYRLSGVAPFPAAVLDVKCAVRWIREHAGEFMIKPEKIAVIGGSAGGHLTMMLAYSNENEFREECADSISSKVQAIVNLYGPTDLTTEYARGHSSVHKFLGTTYQENPQIYISASPKTYISPDDPPTLIFQGTIDSLVPVSQSDSLNIWLNNAGVFNEYHRLKGWPHTMDVSQKVNEYCQYYMDEFFKKYLRPN
ncbi:alpha/beta hydrolase fold domain-containing protein [Bacteroidota bacterium]